MTPFPAGLRTTWVPVALSPQLKSRPLARQVAGTPIVLFRGKDGVVALEDRCPHRNYPLSEGRVSAGVITCPYHGWRFDSSGACIEVPGGDPCAALHKLNATRIEAAERHGAVFVRLEPGAAALEASLPPLIGDPGHDHFWWTQEPWTGRALDALENILDPFHTNFIHEGLVRVRNRRQEVRLTVTLRPDGVEALYEQDGRDEGLMSRLYERNRARTIGRYLPPIAFQGRWETKERLSMCATAFFVPETQDRYRAFGCWTTPKGRLPAWFKRQAIMAFVRPIARQDRQALLRQHEVMTAFGRPSFKSAPTDRLIAPITRLYMGERLEPEISGPHTLWL